ncbi:Dps family protein [Woodsholea maritima]|uniref:Dps family protein n=1 Tax=Woodsholea maritima TaxID=240237 RepID=UPI00037D34E5|nr:DNA starvation/stationary phase protection protein [Woodsholea maritima]
MVADPLKPQDPKFNQGTGIAGEDRKAIAEVLGVVLADSYMLFIKTQGVHWNVVGPSFYSLHELTEGQYQNLYEAIDEIAERIRALGLKAPASYTKYGELSAIKDRDETLSARGLVEMLIEDHRTAVKTMRGAIEDCEDKKDFVTADMMIERMAWHEEAIWMLSSIISED